MHTALMEARIVLWFLGTGVKDCYELAGRSREPSPARPSERAASSLNERVPPSYCMRLDESYFVVFLRVFMLLFVIFFYIFIQFCL